MIYLHGMGQDPIKHEKPNIEAMREVANKAGYKFLAPEASGSCYYLEPPKLDFKCWDNKNIEQELVKIFSQNADSANSIVLVGFSNGGYFLGGALDRGLLAQVKRV